VVQHFQDAVSIEAWKGVEWAGYRIYRKLTSCDGHEMTYRFLMVTRCRENLSSGLKRAGNELGTHDRTSSTHLGGQTWRPCRQR